MVENILPENVIQKYLRDQLLYILINAAKFNII